jgi:DNA-binding transcriptional MerR regulator
VIHERTDGGSLRVSDLSRESGVPVATIKYYLREGLLPRGTPTSATQAVYAEVHRRRLRLIRDLCELGGLRLMDVGRVVGALEGGPAARAEAQRALSPAGEAGDAAGLGPTLDETNRFVDRDLGWHVHPASPARLMLARALACLRRVDPSIEVGVLRPHARAADWLTSEEVEDPPRASEDEVTMAVAFDAAATAFRRLAWEHRTARAGPAAPRRSG